MITLALDASTYVGTAALLRDDVVLAEGETAMRGRDVERLMPLTAEVLARAGVAPHDVQRVVCGGGPGSFTSLRIAAAIAKGLCVASGVPLVAVSSLALVVAASPRPAGPYLATLDALRGEAYVASYDVLETGDVVPAGDEGVVLTSSDDVQRLAVQRAARVVGTLGAEPAAPHARGVVRLGRVLAAAHPVDVGAWEPSYGRLAEAQVRWEAAHGPLRAVQGDWE